MTKTTKYTTALTMTLAFLFAGTGIAFAGHNGADVSHETGTCGETTFTATIEDPNGTHKVDNMSLIVSANGDTQSEIIPTDGSDASITVGPFTQDTTISWRVNGGGERDYDNPSWNGYPNFTSPDLGAYIDENGDDWTLAGPEDPNPFVTWHEVEVEGCPEEPEEPKTIGDDRVKNVNSAKVINKTDASADTGGNYAGGSEGGNGGRGGDVEARDDSDADNNTTGNAGNGGNGSDGGFIETGDATASAGTMNVVNSSLTRINRCACSGGDDKGDTKVRNYSRAFLYNETDADAKTGDNAAKGSEGGHGGDAGEVEAKDDSDADDNTTGGGGHGGSGGTGGTVLTGNAFAESRTLNIVNRNHTRILR